MPEREMASLDELTLQDHELFHDRRGRACTLPTPLAPLADTHGHLTILRSHDASVAVCRAALAGVRLLIVPVDPVDDRLCEPPVLFEWFREVCDKAREHLLECASQGMVPPTFDGWDVPELVDNIRIVAGTHPYGSSALDDAARARLDELLDDPQCVGVGEIGIDLGPYNELPLEVQERAFRLQLAYARERSLPVQLHVRDARCDPDHTAHAAVARILAHDGMPQAGVDVHCFTDDAEVMRPFVEMGCHIAFGGAMTFSRSDDIRQAAALCPSERMLSETDCPYMAPVPLRGQECEPAMVAATVAHLAEVRSGSDKNPADTYRALWENATRLFCQA